MLNRDKKQFTPKLMECSKPQQMLGLRLMAKKELDAYEKNRITGICKILQ